jgi:hypothetical protein
MRVAFLALVVLILAAGCDSTSNIKNPNDTHFIKFFGDDGDQTGADFVVLPDGSFVLFGTTRPSGNSMPSQWYLVKVDAKGNMIWQKTYGGPNDEEARDIELTNDNRLVLLGNTYVSSTNRDVKIMTVDFDGNRLDSAVVPIYTDTGVNALADEDASAVTQTTDGFIVAGSTTYRKGSTNPLNRDGINMRFNNDLTTYVLNGWAISQANGNNNLDDVSKKIYQFPDGSFVSFGYSNGLVQGQSVSNYNFWYFSLGTTGTSASGYKYVGDQAEDERLCSVMTIPAVAGDGYFLTGLTTNASGTVDIKISKLRKDLDFSVKLTSDELYKTSLQIRLGSGLPERANGFATNTYTYYVLSNENGFNNDQNWILTKGTIVDGLKLWSLPIVFGGEGIDTSGEVQELADGSAVMIGTMRTGRSDVGEFKMTLIKVNSDGKLSD